MGLGILLIWFVLGLLFAGLFRVLLLMWGCFGCFAVLVFGGGLISSFVVIGCYRVYV